MWSSPPFLPAPKVSAPAPVLVSGDVDDVGVMTAVSSSDEPAGTSMAEASLSLMVWLLYTAPETLSVPPASSMTSVRVPRAPVWLPSL